MKNKEEPLCAPAKLNLRLKVTGRRQDGYHLLSMLNVQVGLYDRLWIDVLDQPEIKIRCTSADNRESDSWQSDPEKNTAGKAAKLFFQEFGLKNGVHIEIEKNIPTGAGMGGGSSDAGSIINFLANRFFPEKASACGPLGGQFKARLIRIAARVGADVPYFLYNGLCNVKGIGEFVHEIPDLCMEGTNVIIVKPAVSVPTAELFARFTQLTAGKQFGSDQKLDSFVTRNPARAGMEDIAGLIENDLQPVVENLVPQVSDTIRALSTVKEFKVSMTGSGSAVFAVPLEKSAVFPAEILRKWRHEVQRYSKFLCLSESLLNK